MFEKGHQISKKPIEYYVDGKGCWNEINHKRSRYGYPMMGDPSKGKPSPISIHRYIYKKHKGEIPENQRLYNACHNPTCINPDHWISVEKGKSIKKGDVNIWPGGKRENNSSWNEGAADYPEHKKMKRNRLIKLKETKGKCEICGASANKIHHIDGSKDNHELGNLIVMCNRCHGIVDSGRRNESRYTREYGLSLVQMSEKYGKSINLYRKMHDRNELHNFLEKQKASA